MKRAQWSSAGRWDWEKPATVNSAERLEEVWPEQADERLEEHGPVSADENIQGFGKDAAGGLEVSESEHESGQNVPAVELVELEPY